MACRVVTVAGTLASGHRNGTGREALFHFPKEMALLADGSLLVADSGNHCIRQIDPYGSVSDYAGIAGTTGIRNGPKVSALFSNPVGLCITSDGSVIVGDCGNRCVRKIDTHGITTTLTTTPNDFTFGWGRQTASVIANVYDDEEFLYLSDSSCLWKVSLSGHDTKLCKEKRYFKSQDVLSDLHETSISDVECCGPRQICNLGIKGHSSTFFVDGEAVYMISADQKVTTVASKSWQYLDKQLTTVLQGVEGIAVDTYGYMYVTSSVSNYVATVSPSRVGGLLAGIPQEDGKRDGIATEATFQSPSRLLFDPASHCLYVSQQHCIRKVILPMMAQIPAQPEVLQKLDRIVVEGQGTDVTLTVNGQPVHAISALLCGNSEYFQRIRLPPK